MTIVLPDLVGGPEEESALRPLPDALQYLAERGEVVRLKPSAERSVPELAYIGVDPLAYAIAQGPLTVAALGHKPPEGSVQFHLTLASADEDGKLQPVGEKGGSFAKDVRVVCETMQRLKTATLTPLPGEGLDHALVWEGGSHDNATVPPEVAYGLDALANAPRGDGDVMLRRFIDDAINLLNETEENHVRIEEGLRPLNCLWPWGQGVRPDVPNLPLRRGDVVHVVSGSMRLEGLCRLFGYSHGDRDAFGSGLQTNYEVVMSNAKGHRLSLAVVGSFGEMRRHMRVDEIAWNLERLAETVVAPLIEEQDDDPFEMRLVAPASGPGLALTYKSLQKAPGGVPFDERVLDDRRVPEVHVWECVYPGTIGTG